MKGYVFDPSRLRLRGSAGQGRAAGELLRAAFGGGDIFADLRERVRRDPHLRSMLAEVAGLLTSPIRKESD